MSQSKSHVCNEFGTLSTSRTNRFLLHFYIFPSGAEKFFITTLGNFEILSPGPTRKSGHACKEGGESEPPPDAYRLFPKNPENACKEGGGVGKTLQARMPVIDAEQCTAFLIAFIGFYFVYCTL